MWGSPPVYDDAVYKIVGPDGGWVLVGTHVDDLFVLCNEKGRTLRTKLYDTLNKAVVVTNDGEIKWALKV